MFKYLVPDPDMSNIFVFMNRSQPNDDPRSRRVKYETVQYRSRSIWEPIVGLPRSPDLGKIPVVAIRHLL